VDKVNNHANKKGTYFVAVNLGYETITERFVKTN
jgi:hypothetical protein